MVTGAVVQGACMQQYAAAAAWVRQQTACVGGATGGGRRGHNHNGWQAASVRAAAGSRCGVHATAFSGVACVRQRAAAASSTIAKEDSDGSQRRCFAKSSGSQLLLANV